MCLFNGKQQQKWQAEDMHVIHESESEHNLWYVFAMSPSSSSLRMLIRKKKNDYRRRNR